MFMGEVVWLGGIRPAFAVYDGAGSKNDNSVPLGAAHLAPSEDETLLLLEQLHNVLDRRGSRCRITDKVCNRLASQRLGQLQYLG